MATDTRSILTTVEDVMNFMAPYAGGSVPATTDTEYGEWLRWIQLGQQDAANRGFWRRLLTKTSLSITANAETTTLPSNFYKINGIYALYVNGIDWNRPHNEDEVRIFVELNPTTSAWRIRWLPEAPTISVTGELWYFFNPPKPTQASDVVFLDGEMIGFYALKEYFRKLKQLGSLDDARLEYENRFNELLALEMMPTAQEMLGFSSFSSWNNVNPKGRQFYSGRARRGRSGF